MPLLHTNIYQYIFAVVQRGVASLPKPKVFKPGEHQFLLDIPPDLNLDLHAFCELHYDASKAEVTRRALGQLIKSETAAPQVARQFNAIRRRLAEENGVNLRLVDGLGSEAASVE